MVLTHKICSSSLLPAARRAPSIEETLEAMTADQLKALRQSLMRLVERYNDWRAALFLLRFRDLLDP